MDLITRIKSKLNEIEIFHSPIIELNYDNQKNIVGYITDRIFKKKSDEESQSIIWKKLKDNFDGEELSRIVSIFHETPEERVQRINGYITRKISHSNFWGHLTPDQTRFWLFIDVAKFNDVWKSFYLIINEKEKINTGLTFKYPEQVIEFMELDVSEIYDELYRNAFENAESDIKLSLMNKYEKLTEQQLYGKANRYWYVYEDFELYPVSKSHLIFNQKEVKVIREALKKIDDFKICDSLNKALSTSQIFNELKGEI
ncbi:hypothetical protein [Winogradskyella forsetii]|uniref:hypothetical protein n=1 Tax=Winogradskyella forsetii TaxID=2686077 RepID=UPI0015C0EE20|nr:hypothetical protein [Winogradskyella forsetii]